MNFNKLSHAELVTSLHTNEYEHRESLFKFVQIFFMFGFLGLLVGGFFDYAIRKIESDTTNKLECAGYLGIQFVLIAIFFYALLVLKKGVAFDDWLMGTFAGSIFALSFFTVQQQLTNNMQCIFTL